MAKQWTVTMNAQLQPRLLAGTRRGLLRAGKRVLAKSQQDVPYDTGDLSDSAFVDAETSKRVAVGYTDPKAAAAHENLTAHYQKDRTGKFLEKAFNSERHVALEDLAREIRAELGT